MVASRFPSTSSQLTRAARMPNAIDRHPFIGEPIPEVDLPSSPLVRVLAVVNFPPILSIEKKEFVSSFQEAIRSDYPILQPHQTSSFMMSPDGNTIVNAQLTWRFSDLENNWRVSLSTNFLALETTTYLSRKDFLERLEKVLKAIETTLNPQIIERFGLRYIDRVVGQNYQDLSMLIRAEIAGIMSTEFAPYLRQTINESLFVIPETEAQMLARWGVVPSNTTFDPLAIEGIAEPSWVLDIDMSITKAREFKIELLLNEARRFAEQTYSFFRWVVNDEFLRRYGGIV